MTMRYSSSIQTLKNADLAQKQLNISLLEQKNAQFILELVEQQKTIAKLNRQSEDKERHRASYLHKMEEVNFRVQDLKAALQKKEQAFETQKKYCQELKGMVWKRDSVIGQLQLAEQQLQSSLARQEAEHEALQCLKEKLHEEKVLVEKNLAQVEENNQHLDYEALHKECERAFLEKEATLHKQRRQIYNLQKTLQSTEVALTSKHEDRHHLMEENKRLVIKYESLRHDFEHAQQTQHLLELGLKAVQERLSTAERIVAGAEQSAESTKHARDSDGSIAGGQAPNDGPDDVDVERQPMASIGSSAMKSLSRGGNIPIRCKTHSSQASVLLNAGNKVSFKRRQDIPDRLRLLRTASADGKNHVSNAECAKVSLPPSFPETVNKSERKAWTVASTINSHSYPSGTYGPFDRTTEARTSILSESSQMSSPGANGGLHSPFEIDEIAVGERSSTPPGTFQAGTLPQRMEKSVSSIHNSSRKGTNCHVNSSPCTETSTSEAFLTTNHSSNIFIVASDSIEDGKKKCLLRDSEALQYSRPAKSSVKEFKIVPKLKIPRSPEQSEISGSSSSEVQSCSYPLASREPKACKTFNQRKGYSPRKLDRHLCGVRRKVSQPLLNTSPVVIQFQQGRSCRKGESLKPPTPASIDIQDSCDTALKSLQDEVMKRERGWRRTEANMRAALCQRLKELKDAEKLNLEGWMDLCSDEAEEGVCKVIT